MTLPLKLPPSPFIQSAVALGEIAPSSSVLDIGCHEGRNSVYLAGLGHTVLGITNELADAQGAVDIAADRGLTANCQFVVGDAQHLPIRKQFETVLINEVLHMMSRRQAYEVLQAARDVTQPGGLHLVSGYVVDPKSEILTRRNRDHCLRPSELSDLYNDWDVTRYEEDEFAAQMLDQRQVIHSLARIVARKPD